MKASITQVAARLMLLVLIVSAVTVAAASTPVSAEEVPPPFLTQWGTQGVGPGQFQDPFGVAVDGAGNVYVTDTHNNRVQKFTSTGTFLTQWGTLGSGAGQFSYPYGVAVDGAGNVYVIDKYNHRVQKFTSTGTFLTQWGTQGVGAGQFQYPSGVAVDGAGSVYVMDEYNGRVQKFTSTGAFLTQWGTQGVGAGIFAGPSAVAVDGAGNVYVTNPSNHRVRKFASTGAFLTQWGTQGSGAGQFQYPQKVAVDGAGNVYVTDTGNHRVQKFTSTGAFLTQWGIQGGGAGQFHYPYGVAVDGAGNVYVADTGNHRVQKFGGEVEPPGVFKYVALGDSFSAGEGIEDFFERNRCHRSQLAYPTFVEQPGLTGVSIFTRRQSGDTGVAWGFQACSGATTNNVLNDNAGLHGDPLGQLALSRTSDTRNANDLPVDAATDLVTITIGGNNLKFSDIVDFCVRTPDCTTAVFRDGKRLNRWLRDARDALSPKLDRVFARIHQQAPGARILVLGYPQLFPVDPVEQRCHKLSRPNPLRPSWSWTTTEQNYLRQATSEANQLIAARVNESHLGSSVISFVRVSILFGGHEICGSSGEWINAATFSPSTGNVNDQSFHPNAAGQQFGYAVAVNRALGN